MEAAVPGTEGGAGAGQHLGIGLDEAFARPTGPEASPTRPATTASGAGHPARFTTVGAATRKPVVEAGLRPDLHRLRRQLVDEARGDGALPEIVDTPVGGEGDADPFAGPRQADIGEAPPPLERK